MTRQDFRLLTVPVTLAAPMVPAEPGSKPAPGGRPMRRVSLRSPVRPAR